MADEIKELIDNAEEPAAELEGDLKEAVEEKEEVVEKSDINSSGEKETDGEEVVKKLMEDVGAKEKEAADEEGADIPDEFTNYCLKQGWTEDEIKEFAADLDDKTLLAEIVADEVKEKPAEKSVVKENESKQAEKSADETTNKELAAVRKELAEIKTSIGEATKEKTAKENVAQLEAINQAFDEANKNFEIFGKTDELLKYPAGPKKGQIVSTSEAMIARQEVWDKAIPFVKNGIPVKDAMDIALTWYKGANLEKDVERKMIKDLKKHETKLSAKRVGKRTVKTYDDEDDRRADVVREAARKAGVKGEYGT